MTWLKQQQKRNGQKRDYKKKQHKNQKREERNLFKKKKRLVYWESRKKKSVHTSVMKYGVDFKRKENKKYSFFHSSIFAPKKKKW